MCDMNTPCIEHTQRGDRAGYGSYRYGGKAHRAHRVVYAKTNGLDIDTMPNVLHACDNPRCINPKHLTLGTHKDNMDDRDRKGRVTNGNAHYLAKLTSEAVRMLRLRYVRGCRINGVQALAREFGVSAGTMSLALSGSTWSRA